MLDTPRKKREKLKNGIHARPVAILAFGPGDMTRPAASQSLHLFPGARK